MPDCNINVNIFKDEVTRLAKQTIKEIVQQNINDVMNQLNIKDLIEKELNSISSKVEKEGGKTLKNSNNINSGCKFCDNHKGCDNCYFGQSPYDCKEECIIGANGILHGWKRCEDTFCRKCGKKLKINNIQSMDKEFWSDSRKVLAHKMNQVKGFECAQAFNFLNYIEVAGGNINFRFTDDCEIYVWNRRSKYRDKPVSLKNLNEVQRLIKEWYKEELE